VLDELSEVMVRFDTDTARGGAGGVGPNLRMSMAQWHSRSDWIGTGGRRRRLREALRFAQRRLTLETYAAPG
jgi:hypothetical protein